ncbi:MAG: glycosyl transferase [Bacteroidetes bacterium GWE2_39_28]|nr:MAG: glycosyl transferase [Bacteroidetes bacterium GWE2_39_28]OFY13564.1 MAG: glycosyl transferase [Bacteroidetes bacterium GWF2_39_10]OFZ07336.1 MAG: glycosyl transferase [Bacteroidetes bacterium RIFOXYB2_FULL_39_7]OFZ11724.1 MAG: glycosyl transferase [Bacteroidetes bacterium RIFOXYC2_FULL_39_11]
MNNILPDISFVTVNYNGVIHTRELLLSMKRYLIDVRYEVIVVDNGSEYDETSDLIREFPEFTFIRSEINLGFAGGNNIGIIKSRGRYIMLINNDTLLLDNSVVELVTFMDKNPHIGAVSPKIHFLNPPRTIQFAGYSDLTPITLRNHITGYSQADSGQFDTPHETAFNHGAAILVSREALDKVGLMSEDYFLYYEELDWGMRFREKGYKLWYLPQALIVHKESMSTGLDSPLKRYYLARNRLLFAKKNRRGAVRILSYIYLIAIASSKEIIVSLFKKRWDLAVAVFKGVKDFIKM